jgi:hypothetical protein
MTVELWMLVRILWINRKKKMMGAMDDSDRCKDERYAAR